MLMVPLPAADPVSILECPLVSSGARSSYNSGETKCRPITFPSSGVIRYDASCFGGRPDGWAAMQRAWKNRVRNEILHNSCRPYFVLTYS